MKGFKLYTRKMTVCKNVQLTSKVSEWLQMKCECERKPTVSELTAFFRAAHSICVPFATLAAPRQHLNLILINLALNFNSHSLKVKLHR